MAKRPVATKLINKNGADSIVDVPALNAKITVDGKNPYMYIELIIG